MTSPSPNRQGTSQAVSWSLVRDVHQTTVVGGGSAIGDGIWLWDDWVTRVRSGGPGAMAQATRAVLDGDAIPRLEATLAYSTVQARLALEHAGSPLAILGKHGTGKSIVLAQIGQQLRERSGLDIYVVDDYLRYAMTDMRRIVRPDARSIILIDDADVQQAFRPTYNAMGSVDAVVVGTFSDRSAARAFSSIGDATEEGLLPLPDLPSGRDFDELFDRLGRGRQTRPAPRQISMLNIRAVRRRIESGSPPQDVARQLLDLRSVHPMIAMLTWCGANEILLPSALLTRATGGPIPAAVHPWLVSRPAFGSDGETQALWIEDRFVVGLADELWRRDFTLDNEAYLEELQLVLRSLLHEIDPARYGDRLVARQLLRRAPAGVLQRLDDTSLGRFVECIDHETDRGSLLAWIPSTPGGIRNRELINASINSRLAETDSDLGAFVAFLAENSVDANQVSPDRQIATAALWADLIELMDSRHGGLLPRPAFHTALTYLQADPNAISAIRSRNSTQVLAQQVARRGAFHERIWLRDLLLDTDDLDPHSAGHLIELTMRCIMQPRNFLLLDRKWNPPRADRAMVDDLAESYQREFENQPAHRAAEVIDRTLAILENENGQLGAFDHLWASLLRFAYYYHPSSERETMDRAFSFGLHAWESSSFRSCQTTLGSLMHIEARRGMPIDAIRELVRHIEAYGLDGVNLGRAFPALIAIAARSERTQLRDSAVSFFRACIQPDVSEAAIGTAWREVLSAVDVPADWSASASWAQLTEGRFLHADPSMLGLLLDASPEATRASDADQIVNALFSHSLELREWCFRIALVHSSLDTAATFVPANWKDDPNWSMSVARLRAKQGKVQEARALVLRLAGSRDRPSPITSSSTLSQLAHSTRGYESQMWTMFSNLGRPGELRPFSL